MLGLYTAFRLPHKHKNKNNVTTILFFCVNLTIEYNFWSKNNILGKIILNNRIRSIRLIYFLVQAENLIHCDPEGILWHQLLGELTPIMSVKLKFGEEFLGIVSRHRYFSSLKNRTLNQSCIHMFKRKHFLEVGSIVVISTFR